MSDCCSPKTNGAHGASVVRNVNACPVCGQDIVEKGRNFFRSGDGRCGSGVGRNFIRRHEARQQLAVVIQNAHDAVLAADDDAAAIRVDRHGVQRLPPTAKLLLVRRLGTLRAAVAFEFLEGIRPAIRIGGHHGLAVG